MTVISDALMSLSPSAYIVDEFEYLWRTGKMAIACEFAEQNFKRLPDASPLRVAISKVLAAHDRKQDAAEILQKTTEHLLHSGYFFRAVAVFVEYRRLENANEGSLAELFFQLYGPFSEYTRHARNIPPFPEPQDDEIVKTADVVRKAEEEDLDLDDVTEARALSRLWALAASNVGIKLTPGFVPRLPIFSKFQEQTFYQFLQLIDVQKFESMQVVDDIEDGELVWTVGEDTYLRTDRGDIVRLSSGTIMGLEHFYESPTVDYEIIANQSPLLRLPPVTLAVIKSSWETFREDLTVLAFSSILEQRLVNHPLFSSIPTDEYTQVVEKLRIRVVEQGNVIGVSNTENHLGGNSSASSFFLVLAGHVAVEVLQLDDDEQGSKPKSCIIPSPCIVGAFDFFLEKSPTMVFRSTTHLVLIELTASKIQELIVQYPDVGVQLKDAATEVLQELQSN